MAKNKEYLENINTREFYEFYRKVRRKPSKKIDQYNYFKKAIGGMLEELKKLIEEAEHGVCLKGLGVFYKKPYGEPTRKVALFTKKKVKRNKLDLFLEDDFLRSKYIISYTPKIKAEGVFREDKPEAVILHRKLIKKDNGKNNS